jgi:hypothetical protein
MRRWRWLRFCHTGGTAALGLQAGCALLRQADIPRTLGQPVLHQGFEGNRFTGIPLIYDASPSNFQGH